jgi:hypothetical protein
MDTPRFVGLVVSGSGDVLKTVGGDNGPDVRMTTMRAWQQAQDSWEATKPDMDPPMWDYYERTGRASANNATHPKIS